jgi:hypothetical protein
LCLRSTIQLNGNRDVLFRGDRLQIDLEDIRACLRHATIDFFTFYPGDGDAA